MAATGVTALEKTLIGVEASAGGSTDTPTTYWRGTGKIKDRREVINPPERVGKIGGTTRSNTPKKGGEVLLEGDASFEQLAYIFNAGLYAAIATTDTGSGYIRSWSVAHSSTDPVSTTDLNTLVVEHGDNIEVQTAHFVYVTQYAINGNQGEALKVTATCGARDPSTSAAFTAVGDTDLENAAESINTSMGVMYIDDSTSVGSTQKTETILNFNFRHTTGWVPRPAKDGRLDFSDIKRIDDELMLDVTFEHNGVAIAEKSAWKTETARAIRLQWTGAALTSGGAYTNKTFRLDCYGKWQTFGAEGLEEQEGDNIYRGTFRIAYEPLSAKKCDVLLVTDQVTLP